MPFKMCFISVVTGNCVFAGKAMFQNIHREHTQRKSLPLKQIQLKDIYRKISDASYHLKKEEEKKLKTSLRKGSLSFPCLW